MELTLTILSYLFQITSHFCYIYIVVNFLRKSTISNKDVSVMLIISILIYFFTAITKKLFPLNSIIATILLFIVFNFYFKINTTKSIIFALGFVFLHIILELLTVSVFLFFTKTSGIDMLNNLIVSKLVTITINVLFLLVTFSIKLILINMKNISNILTQIKLKHIKMIVTILILTILPQLLLIPINKYNYNYTFLMLNFIQSITISIFIAFYVYNFIKKEQVEKENSLMQIDIQNLGGMVDGVRTIKHDFNNIFQAINGYLNTKKYDELEKYVLKVMDECHIINNLSIINRQLFNDPAIYGVVGAKHFLATEKGVTVDIDVSVDFTQISFPMPELSRILGILLDNSIEATSKIEDKYIRLEIKNNATKGATVIRIFNSYDTSINIELSKIYEKGYSSKKVKSGIGLWEVTKIIKRNKNSQIYATIEGDKFVQNIIIEDTI